MKSIFYVLIFAHLSANAKKPDYSEVCRRFLASANNVGQRPILPDLRSEQEVFADLDRVTREFLSRRSQSHNLVSQFENGQSEGQPVLKQEGAMALVDRLGNFLRFTKAIEKGEYFPLGSTEFHPRSGWLLEDNVWLASGTPGQLSNYKNVKLYSTLYPSAEFVSLKTRAGALASLFKRQTEFLRFHPNVVVYLPVSVFAPHWKPVLSQLPQFEVAVEAEDALKKESERLTDLKVPYEKDVFTDRDLQNLVRQLKSAVDGVLNQETNWILSARTFDTVPFPERTELIVKIEHPNVAIAWRASLELIELYSQVLRRKIPSLTPAPIQAHSIEYFPSVR